MFSVKPDQTLTHSFIVRIWNEPTQASNPDQPSPGQYRGMVIEVTTDEKKFFVTMTQMVEFIAAKSGFPL